jgi:Raf kinase inhibitor-like YbhB/YbcL family protein
MPEGTQSIALLMDSDQLPGERWLHWLIWNIPTEATGVPERVATTTEVLEIGPNARQGINDDKNIGYSGPCPLPTTVQYSQTKVKIVFEYLFHVYALDTVLDLPAGAARDEFLQAIEGHILSGGVIRGEFVGSKQMN